MPNYYNPQTGQTIQANTVFDLPGGGTGWTNIDIYSKPSASPSAAPVTPAPATTSATAPAVQPAVGSAKDYTAFLAAYLAKYGKAITTDQLNSMAYVTDLPNELFILLPIDYQVRFSLDRLYKLENKDLEKLIEAKPDIMLKDMGDDKLLTFSAEFINRVILMNMDRINPARAKLIRDAMKEKGVVPKEPGAGGAEDIPTTHAWIIELGAQDWARKLRGEGRGWDYITLARLREYTLNIWKERKTDPKFAKLLPYAESYYAKTGWWPTEVELNKYTQNLAGVPNISPDGTTILPKPTEAKEGAVPKWEIPKGPDGNPQPLPPGYEWRFTADGTPVPFDNDQTKLDVFSGWYMDPATGNWSYNPFLGAADYLQGGDQGWSDTIGEFANKMGRLPTVEEARRLALDYWTRSTDKSARSRAELFANLNGYWPTPYELSMGTTTDKDANTGGGKAGQPGLGMVPVFVPGVGVVMTQGEAVSAGGFVYDPMQGIPGGVRPWLREVLNGRLTVDQAPAGMQDWLNYGLATFKEQMPKKAPSEIPWGIPEPDTGPITVATDMATFQTAWQKAYPGQPLPTPTQMNSVAWLSQIQDLGVIGALPSRILRQMSLETLAKLDNQTLIDRVGGDIILKLPDTRLVGKNGFSLDYLSGIVTDPARRATLKLPEGPIPTQAPGLGPAPGLAPQGPQTPGKMPTPARPFESPPVVPPGAGVEKTIFINRPATPGTARIAEPPSAFPLPAGVTKEPMPVTPQGQTTAFPLPTGVTYGWKEPMPVIPQGQPTAFPLPTGAPTEQGTANIGFAEQPPEWAVKSPETTTSPFPLPDEQFRRRRRQFPRPSEVKVG